MEASGVGGGHPWDLPDLLPPHAFLTPWAPTRWCLLVPAGARTPAAAPTSADPQLRPPIEGDFALRAASRVLCTLLPACVPSRR